MLENKIVCFECIPETHLSQSIETSGDEARCDFCGETRACKTLEWLAGRTRAVIEEHFEITSADPPDEMPTYILKEIGYEREGDFVEDLISNLLEEPTKRICSEVRKIISSETHCHEDAQMGIENPYEKSAKYIEKQTDDSDYQEKWTQFENSIKTKSRFFSREAIDVLSSIFEDVESKTTWKGESVLVPLGKEKTIASLFRARIVEADDMAKVLGQPDLQIGPPPSKLAGSGRMNAFGISVLYGSTDANTAIAEVRPSVGSRVCVAKFDIVRDLNVLDLDILEHILVKESYFAKDFSDKVKHAVFLRKLGHLCSKPVLPNDEKFDYLTTQAVAEFLSNNPAIDGIAYPSVQTSSPGKNIVLFQKSSRVKKLENDFATSFKYDESVSIAKTGVRSSTEGVDDRHTALAIDIESIQISTISGVDYKFSNSKVSLDNGEPGEF